MVVLIILAGSARLAAASDLEAVIKSLCVHKSFQ
jgi:hypothetical protein